MTLLTVTARGQVTLRREYLEHIGIEPGAKISIEKRPDGTIVLRAAPKGDIDELFGMLKQTGGPSLSIDEMAELAKDGWAGTR